MHEIGTIGGPSGAGRTGQGNRQVAGRAAQLGRTTCSVGSAQLQLGLGEAPRLSPIWLARRDLRVATAAPVLSLPLTFLRLSIRHRPSEAAVPAIARLVRFCSLGVNPAVCSLPPVRPAPNPTAQSLLPPSALLHKGFTRRSLALHLKNIALPITSRFLSSTSRRTRKRRWRKNPIVSGRTTAERDRSDYPPREESG